MISTIYDYHQAGFRVFELHTIEQGGKCACGDPDCDAVGKHPAMNAWQTVPHWSDEQIETMVQYQAETGFGVCLDDHLVIDVDPRNGGNESFAKLQEDLMIDLQKESRFVVATGGGGLHVYFLRPAGAYSTHLHEYPGIDFKTSGFVVGAGSLHITGATYESIKGFPQDVDMAPDALLDLLRKKERTRAIISGKAFDVSTEEVQQIVMAIPNADCHYDEWIRVGMGIHHATAGEGYDLWEEWSAQSSKHNPDTMPKKWHSFGKCSNPTTLGTLIHIAEAAGFVRPVTFQIDQPEPKPVERGHLPFDVSAYDIKRPPGFVGEIVKWMAGNSYSEPLEHLNVISALTAVGNIVGLHRTDDMTGVSTNLISLCIAESATGKEAVMGSYNALMKCCGLSRAVAGAIKSKQEIIRNLIEHQAVFYAIDEMGEVLKTIENAKKRGGAAYLEGITGEVMAIYTKAGSSHHVSGDIRRELMAEIRKDMALHQKAIDEGQDENGSHERKLASLQHGLKAVESDGLFRPFLSMIGYSVPASMETIMTEEMAKNGFLSRAILVSEEKDNPKPIIGATGPKPVPDDIQYTLRMLSTGGAYDPESTRLEYPDEKRPILTEPDARNLLNQLRVWEWDYAELHRETTGFTPLIRRSYELISKVSTILASLEGVRTLEHVQWAAVYIKHDMDRKIRHIKSTRANDSKVDTEVEDGIRARIINLCQRKGGEKEGVVVNRCTRRKDVQADDVRKLLAAMVADGDLIKTEEAVKYHAPCTRYETVVR